MKNKESKKKPDNALRIIPMGGLGEVGKNMTLFEYNKKILIVDMGLKFPEEDMLGIDFIIPNPSYLAKRKKDILGVVFTHGHFDHIGAIPYLIEDIGNNVPMFASALTKGIIMKRQEEFSRKGTLNIKAVKNGEKQILGPFKIEFVSLNHNIPDNFGFLISTPVGKIFHTSDFKFDLQPVNDRPADFQRLKKIGDQGVLLLMSDSTGAEEEGHSLSEKEIMANLEKVFQEAKGRIIVSSFSSLINRIQQVITLSEKYHRKVAIEGRSMKTNVEIAQSLKYIKMKRDTQIEVRNLKRYSDNNLTILCTGAQGEPNAALMRIVSKEHRFIRLKPKDTLIFSSSIIPGNERTVQNIKDDILRQGVNVYHYKMMDIHAGGHAKKEEIVKMIKLIKPKFFIPVHGQYSMLVENAKTAKEKGGVKDNNIIIAENGQVIRVTPEKIELTKEKVESERILIDGSGVGDIGEIVLRDRRILSQDGIFVIIIVVDKKTGKVKTSPDIISRGFVYLRESQNILAEARKKTTKIVNSTTGEKITNWSNLKDELRSRISGYLYSKTERRPMVVPVIIEV